MNDKTLATPQQLDQTDHNKEEQNADAIQNDQEQNDRQSKEDTNEEEFVIDDGFSIEDLEQEILSEAENAKQMHSETEPVAEDSNNEEEPVGEQLDHEEQEKGILVTKPLKYRGKEIYPQSEDELIELAQKGLDYSFKMNKIKPYRNIISIIESSGLTEEDIQALADAKGGNREAIKYISSKFGIDDGSEFYFDEEESSKYKPVVEKQDEIQEMFQEIAQREPGLAGKVKQTFDELDPSFQAELWNPRIFPAFIESVRTGEFDNVFPRAAMIKASNQTLSWLEAYQAAAQNIIKNKEQKKPERKVRRKNTAKRNIKKQYEEIWDKEWSIEDLEKEIFKKNNWR